MLLRLCGTGDRQEQPMTDRFSRLPPMPSMTGPKSTDCEVQRWTTTTVNEARAAKERFVHIPSQSAKTSDPEDERCEVFRWATVSVDEVLRTGERGLRCVECKMPVRVHRALEPVGSPAPHF